MYPSFYTYDTSSGPSYTTSQPNYQPYSFQPNGTGGVNYFNNGTPITREQWASGTNQDPGAVESYVSQNYPAPTAQSPTGGLTGGNTSPTGGTSTSVVDPAVAALLSGEIGNVNSQIGNLGGQQQIDQQNAQDSFNQATNRENQGFQTATDQYNTQKQNTIQDLLNAKGNIATQVRGATSGLQRLLGLAGSGTSSASEIAAPAAASSEGSALQNGVQQTYGRNMQGLDTAFNTTKQQHDQNANDLNQSLFQNQQKIATDINSTKSNLLNTLAQLTSQQAQANGESLGQAQLAVNPIEAQIQSLLSQQAGNSRQYQNPINLQNPTSYTAPTLGSYNYGSLGAPTSSPGSSNTAPNSPYLLPGLAQKQQPLAIG